MVQVIDGVEGVVCLLVVDEFGEGGFVVFWMDVGDVVIIGDGVGWQVGEGVLVMVEIVGVVIWVGGLDDGCGGIDQ